jgi:threonine synthase
VAFGINVPKPLGDFIVLDVLYSSKGIAVAVSDEELLAEIRTVGQDEGLFVCPEGAAAMVAVRHLVEDGWIASDECVVVLNTGAGIKYPECVDVALPVLAPGTSISSRLEAPQSP